MFPSWLLASPIRNEPWSSPTARSSPLLPKSPAPLLLWPKNPPPSNKATLTPLPPLHPPLFPSLYHLLPWSQPSPSFLGRKRENGCWVSNNDVHWRAIQTHSRYWKQTTLIPATTSNSPRQVSPIIFSMMGSKLLGAEAKGQRSLTAEKRPIK